MFDDLKSNDISLDKGGRNELGSENNNLFEEVNNDCLSTWKFIDYIDII